MRHIKKGATSQSVYFVALDSASTIGGRKTGLVYNSSGLTAYYVRSGGSATAITLATLAAANSAFSSGGFKEVDATNMPGIYRLDVPDAALASGADSVVVTVKGATGMVQADIEIQLTGVDLQDAVRGGMTALPNANAEAAGGLFTRGTGAGQINQANNGQIDANAARLGGTTQTGRDVGASVLLSAGTGTGQLDFTSGVVKANLAQILGTALTETAGQIAAAFKKWFDVAAPVGTVNSIPNATAGATGGLLIAGSNAATTVNLTGNITGSVSGSVGSVTGAVGSVTGNVGGNVVGSVASVTAAVTVGTNNDKTGYGLSSAAVQAIWDALTSALTTVGSVGKLLVDNINATISSRLASASYTAPLDAAGTRTAVGLASANLDTQLSGINAKTTNLPASPAATSDIPTAAVVADAVWDEAISGHLTAGSTGNALNAAGSAGDPWSTPLPGAYGAGTAGKIIGDNIDAAISSRLASGSYAAPLDAAGVRAAVGLASANLDTQIAALATASALSTVSGNVSAVKVKTDSLTFTVAGEVNANTRYIKGTAITGAGTSGSPWGP